MKIPLFLLSPLLLLLIQSNTYGETAAKTQKAKLIQLEVTTHLGDNQTFREGDSLSFYVTLDTDAYLLLIYETASDQLIQIIPNANKKSNFYKSGFFISIPEKGDKFQFKIEAPFGQETLWAFASDTPFYEIKGKTLSNGLRLLETDMLTIKENLTKQSKSAFGEAKLQFKTEKFAGNKSAPF